MVSAVASMPAMAAAPITAIFSPSLPSFLRSHHTSGHRAATTPTVAFSRRFRDVNPSHKRSGGKATLAPATDEGFGVLETELWRLRRRMELRLHRLAVEADEAYRDLRYAARDVGGDRLVITFRRSSLRFAACTLFWSLAFTVAARALLGMVSRAWWWLGSGRGWWGGRGGGGAVVRRRDRSLGGKEVVVAVSSSPMSAAWTSHVQEPARVVRRREPKAKVPDWWPEVGLKVMEPRPEMEKWTRLANRLVRAIIDNRITGRDYRYDDAIQLRQICKTCGIKVSFDTENARDSFYRAAVNFVLDDCSRGEQVNDENPRDFLAGLATNIGLDNPRAATLVCASVAARTRTCTCFLQCWALEIQGKRPEALDELLKICRIHNMFPPEDNSAEMEMVAAGLENNLQVAERVHLLTLFRRACTTANIKTAAEALGLNLPDE
ncbi:uncharacterized protein LOC120699162 isoform X2 [Panicum virgatum]|uniref:Uncharacterized protein n=1 Tax=Panicum virgatum TaxID=38727 RepID=A0A8T0V587_PANVG|nr:uncharacterized protein LOC120699162 isoform X2 [Panicum virgatum]KAG2628564.1 hypothetical protein PVAP13_3KG248700 [Panicum virgatum]